VSISKSISICAPAYNEAATICDVIFLWQKILMNELRLGNITEYEIIICDDGSTDQTVTNLKSLEIPNLIVLQNNSNCGAGIATRNAITASKMNYVITIDSDGQFNLLDAIRWLSDIGDSQVVFGYRKKHDSIIMQIASRLSTIYFRKILNLEIPDANCMLKLIVGVIIRELDLRAVGMNYSGEMTFLLIGCCDNYRWEPVTHSTRISGISNSKFFRDGIKRLKFQRFLSQENRLIRQGIISNRNKR